MNERIFITGATGLVGSHAARHLSQRGCQVVAAVRSAGKAESLKALPGVTVEVVGIDNQDALVGPMTGCSAVVHCAAAVDVTAGRASIYAANVDGTRNVLNAAIKAGVRQFIQISSLSVITGKEDQFDLDESAPLRYSGEAYGDSKADAEKLVQSQSHGIAYSILRPGFIYGPGERAWMPRLINNLRNGKVVLIDGGRYQTNVIYVENLVKAIELSLFNEKAFGQVFNLTDGNTPSKKELFDAICDGIGLPHVQKVVPRPVVRAIVEVVAAAGPFLPEDTRQRLSRFSRGAFRLAGINQGFSIRKAEQQLGYVDRIPFAKGMAETMKSFRSPAGQEAPPAVAGRN